MKNSFGPRRDRGGRGRSQTRSKNSSGGRRFGGSRRFSSGKRGGGYSSSRGRSKSKAISHDKFVNLEPTTLVEEAFTPKHTFSDFGFHSHIVDNLTKKGYKTPTRIQDEAIPEILAGKDVIGLANTGSGKTAAFVLPIIQKLKTQKERETVLVITPTRELAQQIQEEFREFTDKMQIYSTVCVGGLGIRTQIRELRRGPHVVIGTPGRLKDLLNQRVLRLDKTTTLVLDEADQMLDMGFLPDITNIVSNLPKNRQSLCFSATITPDIQRLLNEMLNDPIKISVRTSETGEHIAQDIVKARTPDEKMMELTKMLDQDHFERVLVFGEMKHSVQKLSDKLTKLGFPSMAIHGNKSQPQRQHALNAFKNGKVNILVATGVAARGLDIPNVSHVINFDQPQTHEDYVHRIGRTGRMGKPGQAYTFV